MSDHVHEPLGSGLCFEPHITEGAYKQVDLHVSTNIFEANHTPTFGRG